jgi:hypothetical protein
MPIVSDQGLLTTLRPDWITPQLLEQTRVVWQPYYDEVLSERELVELVLRAARLFDVLRRDSLGATYSQSPDAAAVPAQYSPPLP